MNKRMDAFERKIDGIHQEVIQKFKELDKRVSDVEKSAEFLAGQYESQKTIAENLMKKHSSLSEENKALKKEINNLRIEQERQKGAVNDIEQYGRRECIEVSGVPPKDSENAEEIVIALAKAIGVDVQKEDISACHRVKKSKGDPIIITKFVNRKLKEQIMAHRKNLRNKTVGSLKLSENDSKLDGRIFINDSLTSANRNLFRLVRIKCVEKSWSFAWTRNGVIFARKNEHSPITRVGSVKELDQRII